MKLKEAFYCLDLGEPFIINMNETLLRVPGGWIYSNINGCCFVPFCREEVKTELPFEKEQQEGPPDLPVEIKIESKEDIKKALKKTLTERIKLELQNLGTIDPEVIGGELSDRLNIPFYGWESFLENTPINDLELALNFLVSYDTEKV